MARERTCFADSVERERWMTFYNEEKARRIEAAMHEAAEIAAYCINDILTTQALWEARKEKNMKREKTYNDCRTCKACEQWMTLYNEEKARRIEAEEKLKTATIIFETKQENWEKRIDQFLKAVDNNSENVANKVECRFKSDPSNYVHINTIPVIDEQDD